NSLRGRAARYVAAAALWLVAACGCWLALLLPLTTLLGVLAAVLLPSFLRCVQLKHLHGLLRREVLLLEFVQRVLFGLTIVFARLLGLHAESDWTCQRYTFMLVMMVCNGILSKIGWTVSWRCPVWLLLLGLSYYYPLFPPKKKSDAEKADIVRAELEQFVAEHGEMPSQHADLSSSCSLYWKLKKLKLLHLYASVQIIEFQSIIANTTAPIMLQQMQEARQQHRSKDAKQRSQRQQRRQAAAASRDKAERRGSNVPRCAPSQAVLARKLTPLQRRQIWRTVVFVFSVRRAARYVAAAALWLVAACGCWLALLLPLTTLLGVLAAVLLPSFLRCVQLKHLHGLLRREVLLLEFVQRVLFGLTIVFARLLGLHAESDWTCQRYTFMLVMMVCNGILSKIGWTVSWRCPVWLLLLGLSYYYPLFPPKKKSDAEKADIVRAELEQFVAEHGEMPSQHADLSSSRSLYWKLKKLKLLHLLKHDWRRDVCDDVLTFYDLHGRIPR
ncbi:unnamed protein product, partial [Cladocopium goreaui]